MADWLFRWFDNPDSAGCWALRGNIDEQAEVPAYFMALLRGQPAEPDPGMTLRPCRDPALPRALRPQYQLMLTSHPVYAFLQAKLHPIQPPLQATFSCSMKHCRGGIPR